MIISIILYEYHYLKRYLRCTFLTEIARATPIRPHTVPYGSIRARGMGGMSPEGPATVPTRMRPFSHVWSRLMSPNQLLRHLDPGCTGSRFGDHIQLQTCRDGCIRPGDPQETWPPYPLTVWSRMGPYAGVWGVAVAISVENVHLRYLFK